MTAGKSVYQQESVSKTTDTEINIAITEKKALLHKCSIVNCLNIVSVPDKLTVLSFEINCSCCKYKLRRISTQSYNIHFGFRCYATNKKWLIVTRTQNWAFLLLNSARKTLQMFSKLLVCLIRNYDSTMNVQASFSFSSKYSFWTTCNFEFSCPEFSHEKTAYDLFRKRSTLGKILNIPQSFQCRTKVSEAVPPTNQWARSMAW